MVKHKNSTLHRTRDINPSKIRTSATFFFVVLVNSDKSHVRLAIIYFIFLTDFSFIIKFVYYDKVALLSVFYLPNR